MRPEKIIPYTDLRGRVLNDNRSLDPSSLNSEPIEHKPEQVQIPPTQVATLQREATVFKRNDNFLFVLPKQYTYDMFEGNGVLDPKGNFVVLIVGPFGSGKNSVVNNAIKKAGDYVQQAVEHTSRQKRPSETEGIEYYFVTKDKFERMAQNDELLVWGHLTGNYYGYSIKSIQEALNSGKVLILPQGPNNAGPLKNALEKRNVPVVIVFISPLSREELSSLGGIDKAIAILEERMNGTERNRLKERSDISRAMFESLPDIPLIENSTGNLEKATVNLLSLINVTQKSPQLKFLETGELPKIYLDTTNMKANKNIAVIITGPSGVGKDTIFKELAKGLKFIEPLSHTDRPKRKGEEESVNYYYVSTDEFEKMMGDNHFVEWVMVHNNQRYGKTVKTTQLALDSGNDLIYALNTSAREYYKAIFKKFSIPYVDMFISPLTKEELEKPNGIEKAVSILEARIRKRNAGETEEQIQGRLKVAREWFQEASKYSHIIANVEGNLNNAVNELKQIILAKKNKVKQE